MLPRKRVEAAAQDEVEAWRWACRPRPAIQIRRAAMLPRKRVEAAAQEEFENFEDSNFIKQTKICLHLAVRGVVALIARRAN